MVMIERLTRFEMSYISRYLASTSTSVLIGTCSIKNKPAFRWEYHGSTQVLSMSYSYNGVPYNYEIAVEKRSSNLGIKGSYYYFICPATGKRCRILYLYGGKFVSRHAIPKAMYRSQEYEVKGLLTDMLRAEDLAAQPYRKEYYKDKITPYGRKLEKAWHGLGGGILREIARGGEYADIFKDKAEEFAAAMQSS